MTAPLFLSETDLARVALSADEAVHIVERVLVELGPADIDAAHRSIVPGRHPGSSFQSSTGSASRLGIAGVKWVSVASTAEGGARIGGLVVVNDIDSGSLLGVVDAAPIIALRTAAETVIAARRLARRDSASIGFLAAGRQASAHLEALATAFPLRSIKAYSATGRGAARLAEMARARGLAATVADVPRAAIEGMDIVVSSVPFMPDAPPLAASGWLQEGAFVVFLDFGRRWTFDAPFDIVAVDDASLLRELAESGGRAHIPPGEQRALLDARPARSSANVRSAFVQCGVTAGDLALAQVAIERARSLGVGTPCADR
jgi:ornithine cyclodeaminase/alanine dehydrogenase-like protein (mu-crystallin family)